MSSSIFRVAYGHLIKLSVAVSYEKKQEALEELEKNPHHVDDYFTRDILTKEEAKPYALKFLEENPGYLGTYFDKGILTKEEAMPFALKFLEKYPHLVGYYFDKGILTKEEAMPFVLKNLEKYPHTVSNYFDRDILTKEEAKPFAFWVLKKNPYYVDVYFDKGLVTKEEVMPFALKNLEEKPNKVDDYFDKGILSQEDVDKFKRSRPDSYTHSSHESRHEVNLILGVMKKLNVDKISWQQFQEVHKSSSKKLENIFSTFKGKTITKDQCLKMLSKNNEKHTYSLSYEGLEGDSPQVFLKGKKLTVVKLHMPESLVSKLSPEARKRFEGIKSRHFESDDPFGWARVTRLGDKWFVEEVQSDKNSQIGAVQHEMNKALKSGNVTDDIKKDQAFINEMKIFSNWHEVLLSALLEAARESGVHEIYMHTGATKLSQDDVRVNENKARNLYDKLPARMMFNKKKVDLGNGEHELWHRVASNVVLNHLDELDKGLF